MYYSLPGFPVLRYFPEFAQTHVCWVGDAIQSSHPLSTPSLPALNLSQLQGATPTNSGWVPVISYSVWYYQIFFFKKSQKLCYEMVSCHFNLHFPQLLQCNEAGCLQVFCPFFCWAIAVLHMFWRLIFYPFYTLKIFSSIISFEGFFQSFPSQFALLSF